MQTTFLLAALALASVFCAPARAATYTLELYETDDLANLYGDDIADWFGTLVVPDAAPDVEVPPTSLSIEVDGVTYAWTLSPVSFFRLDPDFGGSPVFLLFALSAPPGSALVPALNLQALLNSDPVRYAWAETSCSQFGCAGTNIRGGLRLSEVPLPATLPLLALGLGGLAALRRRA